MRNREKLNTARQRVNGPARKPGSVENPSFAVCLCRRLRALGLDAPQHGYQRSSVLAQEKPEPKPVSETSEPGDRRPARCASSSSMGSEAAEQLP